MTDATLEQIDLSLWSVFHTYATTKFDDFSDAIGIFGHSQFLFWFKELRERSAQEECQSINNQNGLRCSRWEIITQKIPLLIDVILISPLSHSVCRDNLYDMQTAARA